MDTAADTDAAVLVALRVAGSTDLDGLIDRTGRSAAEVQSALARLDTDGAVRHRSAAPAGWALTSEGRPRGEEHLASLAAEPAVRRGLTEAYERFRRLNPRLLAACTRWQVRSVGGVDVVNDHADAGHDAAAVDDLGSIHSAVDGLLADLEQVHPVLDGYRRRFDRAMRAVRSGDRPWFASPLVDSFHTVWFELHEHLLAILGLDRSSEQTPAGNPAGPPDVGQHEESQ